MMGSTTMRRGAWVVLAGIALLAGLGVVALRDGGEGPWSPAPSPPGLGSARTGPGGAGGLSGAPGREAGARAPAREARRSAPDLEAPALERARAVLAAIERRGGRPLPGYVGGRAFANRERRLPSGRYREYDVHPKARGGDRGPERLVIEQATGHAYYTADHYRTFVPLN